MVEVCADQPGGSSVPGMHLLCEAHVEIFSIWIGPDFWQWGATCLWLPSPGAAWVVAGERGAAFLYAQGGASCCCAPREISWKSIPPSTPFLAPQAGWLHLRVQGLMRATPFRGRQSREAALASTSGLRFSLLPPSPSSTKEKKSSSSGGPAWDNHSWPLHLKRIIGSVSYRCCLSTQKCQQ